MIPLPERSELAARLREFHRRFKRYALFAFAAWGSAVAVASVAAAMSKRTPYYWVPGVAFSIALLLIFIGACVLDRRRASLTRELGVRCVVCDKPLLELNAKLALTTGRCAECGSLVVADGAAVGDH